MKKRILSYILSFILIFANLTSAFAVPMDSTVKLQSNLAEKSQVRIIVELEKEPIIREAIRQNVSIDSLSANSYNSLNSGILSQQAAVKNTITKQNMDLDYHESFTNVLNGFSATMTLEEAKKIEKMKGVKSVTIAEEYERPVPLTDTSKDIIGAIETWDLDFKGEGLVVAVIDSGIDFNHQDMNLTNPSKGKLKSKDILAKKLPGKFYTDKVPYGYNYMDKNDVIIDLSPDTNSHGTHVAGIVGANGLIKGVAPEVQLLAMKVFGNDPKNATAFADITIKAIDDSVKLGADVINMSLGAVSSFVNSDNVQSIAIKNAVEAGVVCSISAGNSNHILDLMGPPSTANPDYGVVGAPGLTPDSIQVGAVENTNIKADALTYDGKLMGYALAGKNDPIKIFNKEEVEFIDGGDGSVEFLTEAEGKVLLVVRGGDTSAFSDKIENAIEAGAAGLIVRNHEAGGDELINIPYAAGPTMPVVFIGYQDGLTMIEGLQEEKNMVKFTGEETLVLNPDAGKMLEFTSWGPTPNLEFKPEITAPGGNIYSTLQDNKYGVMGGTSQAAPHISGGSALVMERINQDFNVSGREKAELVKNLILSTAVPLQGDMGLISPRRQGAGVMNLFGAVTTNTIVTDSTTGISKVELKEVGDNIEFTLKLKNFGKEDLSYGIDGVVQTDAAMEGMNFVEPQELLNAPIVYTDMDENVIDSIEVLSKGETEFKVSIDLSEAIDMLNGLPLNEIFENGTFIDGFISLKEVTDNQADLSIPFMGFYGEWDKAPIVDNTVYEWDKASYYYQTGLAWLDGETYKYLGSPFTEGDPLTENIAFSPNGDGLNDLVVPVLTFLRNAKEVQVNILDKHGALVRSIGTEREIVKNYFGNGGLPEFRTSNSWNWDGKVFGEIKEGEYTYQIKTKIDFPNAVWQKTEFPIKIDLTKPVIESVDYDEASNTIDIVASDNMTPIYKYQVIDKGEVVLETDEALIDLSSLKETPYAVTVKAYDYALNWSESKVIKLKEDNSIPYVYLETPEVFKAYNTNNVQVKGYATSISDLSELKIYGKAINFKYDVKTKRYNFDTTLEIKDGVHMLKVYAKNIDGKEMSFERRFYVDATKPELDILTKPTRMVNKDTNSVKAKIKIKENSGDIIVLVHGNEVFKTKTDWYQSNSFTTIEKELEVEVQLKYGENDIKIIVEDGFGNMIEKSLGKVYRKVY